MRDDITKISIIITGCLLIFSVIVFPILSIAFGYQYEDVEKTWVFLLLVSLVSGIVMSILMILIPPKTTKPKINTIKLGFDNFSSFYDHLKEKAEKIGFQIQSERLIENEEIFFFMRNYRLWEKDCIAVIKTSQLSDIQMQIIEDTITDILGQRTDTINLVAIICVDRITPAFKRYINTPAVQGIKNGRFLSGITFGKRNCYLSNAKNKIGFCRYNRLKQLFLSLIGHEDKGKTEDGLREP